MSIGKKGYCFVVVLFVVGLLSVGIIYSKGNRNNDYFNTDINTFSTGSLEQLIRSSFKDKISYDIDVYGNLTEECLYNIYNRKLNIEAKGDGYSVLLYGDDIENYTRELDARFEFKKKKNGYEISKKNKEPLPGKIMLKITKDKYKGKYIYIYNKALDKYMLLSDDNSNRIIIDTMNEEKYLITNEYLDKMHIDYRIIGCVAIGIVVLVLVYIIIKKRYWFW